METPISETRGYKKGQVIFRQGEVEACMYDIVWGSVGIYVDYDTPQEKLLTKLNAGEFFGEMGLVEATARSATAVSLDNETKVRVITADTFGDYFRDRPAKVLMIMQHMSHRLRELTNDYMAACQTVAETVQAQQSGTAASPELKARQNSFAALSRKRK